MLRGGEGSAVATIVAVWRMAMWLYGARGSLRETHAAAQKLVVRASSRWPPDAEEDDPLARLCSELRQRFYPEHAGCSH